MNTQLTHIADRVTLSLSHKMRQMFCFDSIAKMSSESDGVSVVSSVNRELKDLERFYLILGNVYAICHSFLI